MTQGLPLVNSAAMGWSTSWLCLSCGCTESVAPSMVLHDEVVYDISKVRDSHDCDVARVREVMTT
jgi:hypothetical protein